MNKRYHNDGGLRSGGALGVNAQGKGGGAGALPCMSLFHLAIPPTPHYLQRS